jgi:hypothetical protein
VEILKPHLPELVATISGALFSIAYLKNKYKESFIYVRSTLAFYIFILVSAVAGWSVYFFFIDQSGGQNGEATQRDEYLKAFFCGAALLVGGSIGIPKRLSTSESESEFFNLVSFFIQPIEEQIDAQIKRRVVQLSSHKELQSFSIGVLAGALEAIVVASKGISDERQQDYELRLEAYRADENRFGLMGLLLEFYPAKGITEEFIEFCEIESKKETEKENLNQEQSE